ncbi:hypothetical protein BJ742DRAFT_787782 [Cladochytrium replicatum]|nr:hypothetical protein BJ742DRAFT_787782 [Cladochytrium replicatum]
MLSLSSLSSPPPQATGILGLPAWRPEDPVFPLDGFIASLIAIILAMILGLSLAKRFSLFHNREKMSLVDTSVISDDYIPRVPLMNLIQVYIMATIISAVFVLIFDLSKMFAMAGALHNAAEVALIILLTRTDGPMIMYPIILAYLPVVWAVSTAAPWPFDAGFFKFQGLISDFLLFFCTVRLYLANRYHHFHPTPEREAFLSEECLSEDDEYEGPVYKRIMFLVLASAFHTAGNLFATFSPSFGAFLVFIGSYAIAFPLYGCFVFTLGPRDHMIRFPSTPTKELWYFLAAFVLSAGSVGYAFAKAFS